MTILTDLTQDDHLKLLAQLGALQAENERLRKASTSKLTLKVSEKGAVSVYGMGRFPLTLYKGQWVKLIENIPAVKAFIEAHSSELSEKD